METVKEWAGLIAVLLSLGATVYAWLTSGSTRALADLAAFRKTAGDDLKAVCDDIDELERKVQAIEGEMKHMPDKDSVHRLELAIKDMQGSITAMAASAQATERTARRVEEFLLNQGKAA